MRLVELLFLALFLCPAGAGLGRELGSLEFGIQHSDRITITKENDQNNQTQKSEKNPLTNVDVVNMVKAGLTESTIVLVIHDSSADFDTSPQALNSLQGQAVPQTVINAMLAAGREAHTKTAGSETSMPAQPASAATSESAQSKASKPDLHKIRKVVLEMDWAEDENARPRAILAIQKRTCLKVVDTLQAADATISWSNQGLMGVALNLQSKDGRELWNKRGITPPLKSLNQLVGCP